MQCSRNGNHFHRWPQVGLVTYHGLPTCLARAVASVNVARFKQTQWQETLPRICYLGILPTIAVAVPELRMELGVWIKSRSYLPGFDNREHLSEKKPWLSTKTTPEIWTWNLTITPFPKETHLQHSISQPAANTLRIQMQTNLQDLWDVGPMWGF